MPSKTMDVEDQRVQFVVSAERQLKPFRELCAGFGISRPTGYEWLGRYRQRGLSGIAEQSRRPHHSPERTAEQLEARVVELRLRYPDWARAKAITDALPHITPANAQAWFRLTLNGLR